ncbi:MAG: YdiU family protein [Deltaproteobacteria bacterium]
MTYSPAPALTTLSDGYFDIVEPATFPQHILRYRNDRWAARVGLDDLDDDAWVDHLARFTPLQDNLQAPLAMRYHGHQFRSYNPNLGDGRGFTFAQLRDDRGRLLDLGTKGSGTTPYSRGGDGRLTLKGGVREVLATAMLEALGVDTSKSFSLVETGEALQRNDEPSPTRSSVLVRLSHGHIRYGTFQRLAAHGDRARAETLIERCLEWYLPDAADAEGDLVERFFDTVVGRAARTCAQWMTAGFVHGVLNTDNMNVSGESFDYGPYRFLPHYDPTFTAAYFDHSGLYAYGRQPETVLWNLTRLAEAIRPVSPSARLEKLLESFDDRFHAAFLLQLLWRLGLEPRTVREDGALADTVFAFLGRTKLPFDALFFDAYGRRDAFAASPHAATYAGFAFADVRALLDAYEPAEGARLDAPYFERAAPVTLTIDVIEAIWEPIDISDDWEPFERQLEAVDALRFALRPDSSD